MNKTIFTLTPRFENVKSYYGKAKYQIGTIEIGNNIYGATYYLYSYGKLAAACFIKKGEETFKEENCVLVKGVWNSSKTTLRHVKEFLSQKLGYEIGNKSYLDKNIKRLDKNNKEIEFAEAWYKNGEKEFADLFY